MFSRSLAGAQILHWRSGSQTVDGTYRSANNHLFHAALFTLVIDNVCVCVTFSRFRVSVATGFFFIRAKWCNSNYMPHKILN